MAESSVTTPSTLFGPLSSQYLTIDAEITALFLVDYAKVDDGGDSNQEGDQGKEHYNTLLDDLEEQHIRNKCNDIDAKDTRIPGALSGWIPPGPLEDWVGYQPKFDAPKRWNIDNPGD